MKNIIILNKILKLFVSFLIFSPFFCSKCPFIFPILIELTNNSEACVPNTSELSTLHQVPSPRGAVCWPLLLTTTLRLWQQQPRYCGHSGTGVGVVDVAPSSLTLARNISSWSMIQYSPTNRWQTTNHNREKIWNWFTLIWFAVYCHCLKWKYSFSWNGEGSQTSLWVISVVPVVVIIKEAVKNQKTLNSIKL